MKSFVITFYSMLFFVTMVFAGQDYIQDFDEGAYVNWTKGMICVTGSGLIKGDNWTAQKKVDAHRAASLDAMRRLVEVIHGINIDSDTKVVDFAESSGTVRTKISGMVRNFTEKDVRFLDDGICEVDVFLPINGDGSIAEVFLGGLEAPYAESFKVEDSTSGGKMIAMGTEVSQPDVEKVSESEIEPETVSEPEKSFDDDSGNVNVSDTESEPEVTKMLVSGGKNKSEVTRLISGLVINAGGKEVRPALCPSIITEKGEEVYGFSKADRDFRKMNGLASYATDLNDARIDKRVTENPYIVKAIDIDNSKPCIIVISSKDAKEFMDLNGSSKVLNRCRVIIVTNVEETSSKTTTA